MNAYLKNPTVLAWLALVFMTLLVWFIGVEHGFARVAGSNIGLAAVLVLAFVKVQLVGNYFMELRAAPLPLRLAFSAWVVGVGAMVVAMYLLL